MLELIPTGSENAILSRDLARLRHLSVRTVKEKIKSLRREGVLILSQSTGGYFFPVRRRQRKRGSRALHQDDEATNTGTARHDHAHGRLACRTKTRGSERSSLRSKRSI
jgi:biotin operon repressor